MKLKEILPQDVLENVMTAGDLDGPARRSAVEAALEGERRNLERRGLVFDHIVNLILKRLDR